MIYRANLEIINNSNNIGTTITQMNAKEAQRKIKNRLL